MGNYNLQSLPISFRLRREIKFFKDYTNISIVLFRCGVQVNQKVFGHVYVLAWILATSRLNCIRIIPIQGIGSVNSDSSILNLQELIRF